MPVQHQWQQLQQITSSVCHVPGSILLPGAILSLSATYEMLQKC